MRKKSLLILAASLILLAGCGSKEEDQITEITLMHGWGGSLPTHEIMQEIYDGFGEQNPDIKLTTYPSSVSNIAVNKANDMLAVGKMPDIVSTNGLSYYVSNAVKRNMALDLMPYIEKDKELKQSIHPAILSTWKTTGGKLYTVPDALEIMGYWYNKAYFKAAGIVDENGEVALPHTWEEFFLDLEKLECWGRAQDASFRVANLEDVQLTENFYLARLAGSKGGNMIADNRLDGILEKDFLETFTDIRRLGEYSIEVDNVENARQSFIEGKTALYFNGVWESEPLSANGKGDNVGYSNYPTDAGKSLAYVSASSGYVLYDNPDPRKKEAGIRFLKYMLSNEVQKKLAVQTGQAPSNPQVSGAEIKKGYPLLGEALDVTNKAEIHIRTLSSIRNSEEISTLAGKLMDVALGKTPPEEAAEDFMQ